MSRRRSSRPWVALVKDGNAWWPRGYFNTKEEAEQYAINKSKNNNQTYRITPNTLTNPDIKRKNTSVNTVKGKPLNYQSKRDV